MKNKILLAILFSFFLSFTFSYAQWTNSQIVGDDFIVISPKKINVDIEGSPYIPEDFIPAKISVYDNKIFAVKYDAFIDEILVLNEDDSKIYALKNTGRKSITITLISNNKTYQIFDFLDDSNEKNSGFFVVLSPTDSHIKLLKKETVKFYEEKPSTSGYDKAYPAEYRRLNDSFYLTIANKPAIKVSTNKKDIAELFPEHEKEILDYIKSEKIKLKEEADLQKLVMYLQGLQ